MPLWLEIIMVSIGFFAGLALGYSFGYGDGAFNELNRISAPPTTPPQ